MKRTPFTRREPQLRKRQLVRKQQLKRQGAPSTASKAQREKARQMGCAVGEDCYGPIHPHHVCADYPGNCLSAECVIGLCATHHRLFHDGQLDLQRHLVGRFVAELQHALGHYDGDLLGLLNRLCGERYVPAREAA
jgi:hypothetical protein